MTGYPVVIAGGGPTGMMLAGELAIAGVKAVIVERQTSRDFGGSRAGGLYARTLEVLDQRGIADRCASASSRKATRLSAASGSPAARARAAAVIRGSIRFPSYLLLTLPCRAAVHSRLVQRR
jgi:2-polyprenyl-6-methoxyphenol hydroxylase-like FAD-dependent oxidoreductase